MNNENIPEKTIINKKEKYDYIIMYGSPRMNVPLYYSPRRISKMMIKGWIERKLSAKRYKTEKSAKKVIKEVLKDIEKHITIVEVKR